MNRELPDSGIEVPMPKIKESVNWEEKLLPDEIITDKQSGKKLVLLRGLQRLSHEAGIAWTDCQLSHVDIGDFGIFQCIYRVRLQDGRQFVGTADCNTRNTDADFIKYPTAVSESRAEARALRKALNIRILSVEEIGLSDNIKPSGKISDQVVAAIKALLSRADNLDERGLMEKILSPDRKNQIGESIFGLSDLTVEEGGQILKWFNTGSKNTSSRINRKEELKKILDGE